MNHRTATITNVNSDEVIDTGVPEKVREEVWQDFVAFLKKGGHNITETRRIILNAVLDRDDHFRADQLAAQLISGPNRVSRGSVYRTLALLSDAGIVQTLRDGDAHVHYEHVIDRAMHEHMICDQCGKFIEFESSQVEPLVREVCETHGFTPRVYRLVVHGHCDSCEYEQDRNTDPQRDHGRTEKAEAAG